MPGLKLHEMFREPVMPIIVDSDGGQYIAHIDPSRIGGTFMTGYYAVTFAPSMGKVYTDWKGRQVGQWSERKK